MKIAEFAKSHYFQLFVGLASITAACLAVIEFSKKSKQYDLLNQKTLLDIEKANIELKELKRKNLS